MRSTNANEKKEREKMKELSYQPNFRCGRHLLRAGLFFVGLMACLVIGVSTAQAQNYFVKDMGLLAGAKTCEPAALNNQGHVVGTAVAGEFGYAFRYYYDGEEDEMERVGELGSRAFGIGPTGIVVGDAFVPKLGSVSHAAFFKGGAAADLGVLKGQVFSRANAINSMLQVVGFSGQGRDVAQSRAFIWTANTGMLDLGTLGGEYAQAYAINDAGWVTGTAQIPDMGIRDRATHAFIYQPIPPITYLREPMRDIGTLGGRSSWGMSINASRHVAGYSTTNDLDNRIHGFFYDGKVMIDLGSLVEEGLGDYSVALAVNNSDQVVGYNYLTTGDRGHFNQVAFIWNQTEKGGQMIDLNKRIAGWSERFWLLSAISINDHGQIAARAYDYQEGIVKAVLLTPVK